jgi:RNA polymerase sigma factor (sigma-70 family)
MHDISHPQNERKPMDFEQLVNDYYQDLYRFGLSLSRAQADACDLVQQTFALWAEKGHQLRNKSKVKSWLFTTLYREFIRGRKRADRFPHLELTEVETELPTTEPNAVSRLEAMDVMDALGQVDETFRVPLSLFFIGNHSYAEIAAIIDVPMGTVMSRISRGKQQLKEILTTMSAIRSEHEVDANRERRVP